MPALEAHGEQGKGKRRDGGQAGRRQRRFKKKKRGASNTQADQQADAPDLAAERDALWDASALSPAGSASEADYSPGVRAALDQIFPADTPPGRVAERSAVYDAGATDGARERLEALTDRYSVTLETLATRLDLSAEVLRTPSSDCPPALLVEVAKALRAPMAEVALALRADEGREHAPDQGHSFVERSERRRPSPKSNGAAGSRYWRLTRCDWANAVSGREYCQEALNYLSALSALLRCGPCARLPPMRPMRL